MVVISAQNLKCVRKLSFIMMLAKKRLEAFFSFGSSLVRYIKY